MTFSDVFKMCSDLLRCLQMIAVVLVFSLDVPKMILRCSQDFSERFPECSQDALMGFVGLLVGLVGLVGVFSNECMEINDPKEFNDHQAFDDQKGIAIESMDFDNPKVYGDTSIFDDLVGVVCSGNMIMLDYSF